MTTNLSISLNNFFAMDTSIALVRTEEYDRPTNWPKQNGKKDTNSDSPSFITKYASYNR